MSLVEKALRKLQESAPSVAPAGEVARRSAEAGIVVQSAAEAARQLSLAINFRAVRAAGLLPPEQEERQLAQQYRRIKRPLIAGAIGHGGSRAENGHLILIASAMAGEGKTFTALNLALSMSIERDVHVLLVDADVAKPHVSRVFEVADAPGLLDVLRDETLDVERFILKTSIPNFSVLPAGTLSSEATELLASARMEKVVQAIGERDRQRIVVFDSPPLLQTTESHVLIRFAGQVVVVVRAGYTPQPVLLDALSVLEGHKGVSLVLNQSTASANTAYYYYGYGDSSAKPSER